MQERTLSSSAEWRRQIAAVDAQILNHLRTEVAGGFDEATYGNRMGFASLKRCAAPGFCAGMCAAYAL